MAPSGGIRVFMDAMNNIRESLDRAMHRKSQYVKLVPPPLAEVERDVGLPASQFRLKIGHQADGKLGYVRGPMPPTRRAGESLMKCRPEDWVCSRCGGGMLITERFGRGVAVMCSHVCQPVYDHGEPRLDVEGREMGLEGDNKS